MNVAIARIAAAGLLVAAFGAEAIACSTRHFYNKSDWTWTILVNGTPITCRAPGSRPGENKICDVKPGETATLHYPTPFAVPNTRMTIRSPKADQRFDVGTVTRPCYIKHSGSTGNIVVNDPADGDIVTCGRGTYPCR